MTPVASAACGLSNPTRDDLQHQLFIRMNQFQPINDLFGHAVGDQVLQELIESIGALLLARLAPVILAGEHRVFVGASVGCARYPQDGIDEASLLQHADAAMYAAKRQGGNQLCFFAAAGDPPAAFIAS